MLIRLQHVPRNLGVFNISRSHIDYRYINTENIDIDIDMAILENIDIDKGILQNIDIDKISYW